MEIKGLEGVSVAQLADDLERGARFVRFEYVISVVLVTFRRSSAIYYLRPGQSALSKSWPYTLLSAVLGWWGIPWGFIYTPGAIFRNLRGGRDLTQRVMDTALGQKVREARGYGAPSVPGVTPEPSLSRPQSQPSPAAISTPTTAPGDVCPSCGAAVREEAAFCGSCGGPLREVTVPAGEVCSECGAAVEEDWRVCPNCGHQLILKCSECGKRVEQGWNICPYCEADLPDAVSESAVAEAEDEPLGECQVCGEPVEPDWIICPACGLPLHPTCPECNQEVEHGWSTCPFCEADLESASSE